MLNPCSHTHCQVARTKLQSKTWQRVCLPHHTAERTNTNAETERRNMHENLTDAKNP